MKQFLITVAGVLVGLILFLILAPMALVASLSGASKPPPAPAAMVLTLDLRQNLPDQPSQNPFAGLSGKGSTIEIVRKLEAAARDDKVKGVYVRANTLGVPAAQAEEFRAALRQVRAAKKFVIAHIQNDSLRASLGGYMTVAGADEVWLQETGDFMPMGLVSEETFLGGTMEKFHIQPQFEQREEYKNAVNAFTQKGYTPAHREAAQSLLQSLYGAAIAAIAADRGMTKEQADSAVKGTPYSGKAAIAAKLADKLGRPEDAEAAALAKAGKGAKLVEIGDYKPARSGPVIAVVGGEGDIMTGPETPASPFADRAVMYSDDLAKAFKDAAEDDDVKAIVFRINSPGGSAVASDQILHAMELAKAKGKKIVVSMGPYAASGGYYVAASADSIVASPTTITGSIGIFGGKFVLGEALNRYAGLRSDAVSIGSPYANMFTPDQPFTNAQRQEFAAMIDRGYAAFLGVVAKGRNMTMEQARAVAKGRVWTGAQAKERGLVDELGGLSTAVARAKALAGIKESTVVQIKLFPAEKSPFEQLEELFGVSAEGARAAAALAAILGDERVEAALRAAMTEKQAPIQARAHEFEVR